MPRLVSHPDEVKVLSRRFGLGAANIDKYVELDGYAGVQKAIAKGPDAMPGWIIAEMKASGLRGRGGAGFPMGMKWSFVPKTSPKPKYVLVNGDESEPGTCKDHLLFREDPHAVIEGAMIAGLAVGAKMGFIYLRGEYRYLLKIVEKAVADAYAKGFLGKNIFGVEGLDFDIVTVDDHGVRVERRLAPWARPQPAAEPVGLVAGAKGSVRVLLREVAAVQGPGIHAETVDILHDVDLPGARPRRPPQHPEPGPVTQAVSHPWLLDGGGHHHLATGRRAEQPVGPGLDPARGPRRPGISGGAVAEDDDVEIPVPVEVDVVLRRGHRLDLVGAEDAVAGVVLPVLGVDTGVRRAVEVIGPGDLPRRGGVPRRRRATDYAQNHEHAEPGHEQLGPERGTSVQPCLLRAVGPDRCPPAYPRTSCTNPSGIRGPICAVFQGRPPPDQAG